MRLALCAFSLHHLQCCPHTPWLLTPVSLPAPSEDLSTNGNADLRKGQTLPSLKGEMESVSQMRAEELLFSQQWSLKLSRGRKASNSQWETRPVNWVIPGKGAARGTGWCLSCHHSTPHTTTAISPAFHPLSPQHSLFSFLITQGAAR